MYKSIKRLFDIVVALIVLAVFSPVLLISGLVLVLQLKKSPFFIQERPGLKGEVFKIVKFQTMLDTRNEKGELLPNNERITPFGGFLRKSSIDELPQLFNVLKGDMSIIGPRPLLVDYLPLYSEEQRKRHDVRPGITGWAQVNGRNAISWDQKFKYDVYYTKNVSLILDLKVLYLTVLKVLKASDIQSSASVTMERFTGNN